MPPLRKAASRTSSRGNIRDEGEMQQAGRTPSFLNAEIAAAALRDFGNKLPGPGQTSSAPHQLQKKPSRSGQPAFAEALPPIPAIQPPPPPKSPYAPVVPSPLNPASPDGSDGSMKSRESYTESTESSRPSNGEASSSALPRSKSSSAIGTATSMARPIAPQPRRGRFPQETSELLQPPDATPALRPQTPITLNDLGRDYTRYPVRSYENLLSGTASPPHQPLPPPPHYSRNSGLAGASNGSFVSYSNPFNDSKVGLNVEEEAEKAFTPYPDSMFLDDRINAPTAFTAGYKFPMFVDEKEPDDDMHTPYPDDDQKLKANWREYFEREQLVSMFGLFFMIAGLICVFIVLPVLSYTGIAIYSYPSDTPLNQVQTSNVAPEPWAFVNNVKYPLLQNIRTGLIDPTTPQSAMTRPSTDGGTLQLVFSDEFNTNNRTFYPGDDPYWTAPDFWYGATQDLEWYDSDAATTYDGTLQLQLDKFLNHNLQFRSGMLNSWNQICFKGGALEVSLSLPGPAGSPGLWPGVWTMGNLGRPGYGATTQGVWPYTYTECDSGITPNQSTYDGMSNLPGQKLPACTCPGADHPSPGTGRGAPEIDVIEASVDPNNRIGVVTQSFQVAPFDIWYHPNYDFLQIPNYNTTQMNAYCGGPFQQAISGTTLLNNDWYDQKNYQKYAFEYSPGTSSDGEIAWYVGEDVSYRMTGDSIGPNGNVGARQVSEEPMSIILNLGISNAWTWIDWANLTFPTTLQIDYVRWYQEDGKTSVTCDPEGYETTQYIADHPVAYNNPNLTVSP
ncbi:MAG: hypothetical protein M1827_005232 [Pycnora praestabilis]|nr:MAG: hypothetical protein M1827_005232 [Pycnora praestabilis]